MSRQARIHLGDGSTVSPVSIKHVNADLYCVDDFPDPFTDAFNHRDLIRLQREADGSFDFRGVVTPSHWHRRLYMVPRRENPLELLEPVFQEAKARGGAAMLDFGGCLQVFLPPECVWDPGDAVRTAVEQAAEPDERPDRRLLPGERSAGRQP